jgi:hypothetical protein
MSINYRKVEGHPHLVKDVGSGTFINTNVDEIKSAQMRRLSKIEKQKETDGLKNDIETLKDEMLDIKSLLKQILEK